MECVVTKDINETLKENSRLVHSIIKERFPAFVYDEDFFQVGMIGLWRAIQKFDESKGFKLSTYAYDYIFFEMRNYYKRVLKRWDKVPTVSLFDIPDGERNENMEYADFIQDPLSVEKAANRTIILDEIEQLPERDKTIMLLYLEGYTQMEIKDKLNVPQVTISRAIRRHAERIISKLL